MNKCRTCKYWGELSGEGAEDKMHYCNLSENNTQPKVNEADFGVVDGEPYNAGRFATGPNFGCILHEPTIV